jgi:hypothetical protein
MVAAGARQVPRRMNAPTNSSCAGLTSPRAWFRWGILAAALTSQHRVCGEAAAGRSTAATQWTLRFAMPCPSALQSRRFPKSSAPKSVV